MKKILHICLHGVVTDNFVYQDNLLPKYHRKLGYDVDLITSEYIYNSEGKIEKSEKLDYINEDGVHVIRLPIHKDKKFSTKFKKYDGLFENIEKSNPDIMFIHNCQFLDIKVITEYLKKNKNIKVYVDNHSDFSNSAKNWLSKNILHKIIWKHYANLIEPYTTKFYGVLPARVDFLKEVYKLPSSKCELLVMGADDEFVERFENVSLYNEIRNKLNLNADDFVIVTGGKIDQFKTQTLLLMKAIRKIDKKNVKLLVFGSIDDAIRKEFDELCDNKKVQYLGWADKEKSYEYFSIADLVVFPGRHSVYWEQVVGQGIPMICKYWNGTTHVDIGGNVEFLYKDSIEEIFDKINNILEDNKKYRQMKDISKKEGMKKFSYKRIAEQSIK